MSNRSVATGRSASIAGLALLLVIGGLVLGLHLNQGWFPHDEGSLGQSAERILNGEIPHRDFSEIYTGLLSYVNAAAFKLGGIETAAPRTVLFAFTLLWLGAFYAIARRFVPVFGAVLVSLVALVWSIPNYPAAMPSWYNLFFATFGCLALVRWHEAGHRRWLLLAGVAGGISFLFKLSGAFFILGGVLALTYATAHDARQAPFAGEPAGQSGRGFPFAVSLLLAALVVLLTLTVSRYGESSIVRFVLPLAVITTAISAGELESLAASRPLRLVRALVPFLGGAAIPTALFAVWFAINGALPALITGVFVAPFRRLDFASFLSPHVTAVLYAAPWLWLLRRHDTTRPRVSPEAIAVGLAAAYVVYASARDGQYYRVGWYSAWSLLFVLVTLAWPTLRERGRAASERASLAATISIVAVTCTLIEFPFASPIYTLYALPLTMLAIAALVRSRGGGSVQNQLVAAFFFLVFGLVRVVHGTVEELGRFHASSTETAQLYLTRSDLVVRPEDASRYHELISIVDRLPAGATMWAGPDAPEVYFLSTRPNQTRTLFDFLDEGPTSPPVADRLREMNPSIVVVNVRPQFSRPLSSAAIDSLAAWYPNRRDLDGFIAFWR